MGRRAYLNRLALGRSPYEAPEPPAESSAGQANTTYHRTSILNADEYVQHYDERGHPVNPESKSFGKDLRRAKNDILSTMGIVYNEEAVRERNDKQKTEAIGTENDFGLILVTLDQISVFLGSWWTTSLAARIQTFRSYANVPLTRIIGYERAFYGLAGFYFAGIPAWAISTCLSILRHHPLERVISAMQNFFPNNDAASKVVRASFTIMHSASRGALLALAMQTYMYSLLQSLHLIPPTSIPSLGYLMPLGEFTSMLLPSPPSDLTFSSLSAFVLSVLKTPALFYLCVYLRPVIEIRLYRLLRRHLQKPQIPDEASIKVALDNDLIDWMVPTLGRRGAEETQRSSLSFKDELLYEIDALWQWISSKITTRSQRASRRNSLVYVTVNQQHHETYQTQSHPEDQPLDTEQQNQRLRSAQLGPNEQTIPVRGSDAHSEGADSGLSNEENQIPDPDNMDLLRRARNVTLSRASSSRTPSPNPDARQHDEAALSSRRRQLRSEAFLSESPSTDSSQPSPRVHAQLMPNSDAMEMQIELEARHTHGRPPTTLTIAPPPIVTEERTTGDSAMEIFDDIVTNQRQERATITAPEDLDGNSPLNMTTAIIPRGLAATPTPNDQPNPTSADQNPDSSAHEPTTSSPVNILPDAVEEPTLDDTINEPSEHQPDHDDDDAESSILPHLADPTIRPNSAAGTTTRAVTPSFPSHRVTILSSLPVDSLASHLASMITTALFVPLESLYLRSLARSYLASRGAPASLRADVYPLGAWGGGRSWADSLAYVGKIGLMIGIQGAVNASVWGIVSGTVIRVGRRYCKWGSL